MSMPDGWSEQPSEAGRKHAWLTRSWWTGVVGIGTLVIVVLTAWLVFGGDKATRNAPSTPPQLNSINGNCNGQGAGNTVSCGVSNPKP